MQYSDLMIDEVDVFSGREGWHVSTPDFPSTEEERMYSVGLPVSDDFPEESLADERLRSTLDGWTPPRPRLATIGTAASRKCETRRANKRWMTVETKRRRKNTYFVISTRTSRSF